MTMSNGSLVFTARSASSKPDAGNNNNNNRLAPYNPTHDTAQSTALDLLALTSRDVLFDLGCGDGRLIVAALERCYDDCEYLMGVHRERFVRLQQHERGGGGCGDDPRQHEDGMHHHHQHHHHHQQRLPTHIRTGSCNSNRQILHARSHSGNSVPHLMRTRSNDEVSEDAASGYNCISSSSPYRIPHGGAATSSSLAGIASHNQNNAIDYDDSGRSEDEGDDVDCASSAPSTTTSQIDIKTPSSPETPVACNLRSRMRGQLPPPSFRRDSPGREISNDDTAATTRLSTDSIPILIETPSPSGKSPHHAPQISELPTADTLAEQLADQFLTTVVPSHNVFEDTVANNSNGEPSNNDENGRREPPGGGGLRCVGIEYDRALAEAARANVLKSYVYPHVTANRVCVRWGDVMDEWHARDDKGGYGNSLHVIRPKLMPPPSFCSMEGGEDASKLTLLDDATAVFVYLLPQGLRKVKPLLHEAATLRHGQRERQRGQRERHQRERQCRHHPLDHPPVQKQSSLADDANDNVPFNEVEGGDSSSPCPLPRQLVHRKGFSHVSDITDCDFRGGGSRELLDESLLEILEHPPIGENDVGRRVGGENIGKGGIDNGVIPPFRVGSYMFSIGGWTPSKIDRSSKGGCPIYLYENIHEEER